MEKDAGECTWVRAICERLVERFRASPRGSRGRSRAALHRIAIERLEARYCLSLAGPAALSPAALSPSSGPANWYVSPYGTSSGNGSIDNPWDLRTALLDNGNPSSGNNAVRPGDTIWLIGGAYQGNFSSYLQGAADKPIVVRNYNHQRVTIDHPAGEGLAVVGGGYVWFWGLEVASSNTVRVSQQTGSSPTDITAGSGAEVKSPTGVKLINSIVHDGTDGVDLWDPGLNAELNGDLIYYSGWNAPDRSHGHGIYMQNHDGVKKILDNIIFDNASHGIQAYGTGTSYIDNYDIEGNVIFNNGELFGSPNGRNLLVGGGHGARQETIAGNFLYRNPATIGSISSDFMLGYEINGVQDSVVRNNYVAGALYLTGPLMNVDISHNTFYGGLFSSPVINIPLTYPDNTYLPARPSGVNVFVTPSSYEPGRANITVYNWDKLNTVAADISNIGLAIGDRYELHSAADYYGDVVTGVYQGGALTIPMTGHTTVAPVGIAAPASTFPDFGVFVIIKGDPLPAIAPLPPTNLAAKAGNAQIGLAWTASPGAASYNIYRASTSGAETLVKSGVYGTIFTDAALANGTACHYQVSAVNAAGQSMPSSEVVATPQPPTNLVLAIDAGGPAIGAFVADTDYSGGGIDSVTNAIDTFGIANPAPQAVYQTLRYGDAGYVLPNLTPGGAYTVRLDFAENFATGEGQRVFNVSINGVQVLANFDTFAATGGRYKGGTRTFAATADSGGKITIQFTTVVGLARISGIELFLAIPAAPLPPTNLTAQAGNGQVMLAWAPSAGAMTYNIYRSTSSGSELLVQSGVGTTTYPDAGLSNGTTYFYEVTAVNTTGQSGVSSEVSAKPVLPPLPPANLAAQAGNAQVTLTWTPAAGATSYNLYRSTASGAELQVNTGLSGSPYTDIGLANGTTYFFEITAVNAGGESGVSGEVSAKPVIPAPLPPTNLAAQAGNVQVVLSWTASAGAATYNVYRSTASGAELLVKTGLSGSPYTDPGLANGTTYFYEVTGVNSTGESGLSSEVSAKPVLPAPLPPTNLAAQAGNAQVVLTWTASAGAATYNLYRSTASGAEIQVKTGLSVSPYTDPSLTNGTTYFYEITAVNAGGESGVSSEVSAKPVLPAPLPPTNLAAQAGSAQVVLSWTASAGAASYNLYRSTVSGAELLIKSNLSGSPCTDPSLANGTTYFYEVTAVNTTGESGGSNEVSAKPLPPIVLVTAINAGGPAVGSFLADSGFSGGAPDGVANPIDTSGISNPAPQSVYQSVRYGNCTYTLANLTPGTAYTVRLDFAELFATAAGQRVFNVAINAAAVLTNFDIFVAAGGQFKAIARQFTPTADGAGKIAIQFTTVTGYARINGIELFTSNPTAPAAPAGIAAQAGNGQATITWNASPGATTYNLYRSTASGTELLGKTLIGGTSYTDGGLANGTTYFYQVTAVSSAGESGKSSEVSATPQAVTSPILAIDAGGTAAGAFLADTDFVGGASDGVSNAIDTSAVANPAPQTVYQTVRYGNFSYVLANLTAGGAYTVRLDFAELFANAAGQRVFNAAINGASVLANFDIFAAAGGQFKAIARQFAAIADNAGKITIQFTTVAGYARVNGIELFSSTPVAPAAPANLSAQPTSGQVTLNWTASPGAASYNIYRSNTSGTEIQVKTLVSGAPYADTGLANGTTYFYQVTAVNSVGESGKSNEVSAAPQVAPSLLLAIDAGGAAAGAFVADANFSGGASDGIAKPVDTSGVSNPAPQAVYQTVRYGNFTYTLASLTPGGAYTVQLDFAELFATAAGQRVFNVAINGAAVLANFDIFVAAGGAFKALAKTFSVTADSAGKIAIQFTTVAGYARVNGIELFAGGGAPATPAKALAPSAVVAAQVVSPTTGLAPTVVWPVPASKTSAAPAGGSGDNSVSSAPATAKAVSQVKAAATFPKAPAAKRAPSLADLLDILAADVHSARRQS